MISTQPIFFEACDRLIAEKVCQSRSSSMVMARKRSCWRAVRRMRARTHPRGGDFRQEVPTHAPEVMHVDALAPADPDSHEPPEFDDVEITRDDALETARDIRTGRAQSSGMSQAAFRTAVCDRIVVLGTCDNVEIDVRVFEDFDNVDQSSPIEDGAINTDDFGFDPGDAGDIVLVRVFYRWQLLTPGFSGALANMSGNQHLITAATVFRNEPFDD